MARYPPSRFDAARHRHDAPRPQVEFLESRLAPAVYRVTGTSDLLDSSPPPGTGTEADPYLVPSLRQAISFANESANWPADVADTILVPAGLYKTALTGKEDANAGGDYDLTDAVTIRGDGAASTIIDAYPSGLGDAAERVFDVRGVTVARFEGLTVRGGRASNNGGGIRAKAGGTIELYDCVIEDCTAPQAGGGIYAQTNGETGGVTVVRSTIRGSQALGGDGGGVAVYGGSLTMTESTVSGNTCTAEGGGVYTGGTAGTGAYLRNCTVSGNSTTASETGGGIYVGGADSLFLVNCTVTGNSAPTGGGVAVAPGGEATLTNSLVAGNSSTFSGSPQPSDLTGDFTSGGHNFIGAVEDDSSGIVNGVNGDMAGTPAAPLDPKIGPLADNGGPTQTHALLAGSPAIDAGLNGPEGSGSWLFDQRGLTRSADGDGDGTADWDIGAFEVQPTATGTITGLVFLDYNANGARDLPDDAARAGARVYLDANGNGVLDPGEATALTGPDGRYAFTGLGAGPYTVRQDLRVDHGYVPTGPAGGSFTVTPADTDRNFANVAISQVTPVEVAPVLFAPAPDADTAWVQGLYHNLLGRQGEDAGVAYWLGRLHAGAGREAVLAEFWAQPEHREVQVRHYYRTFLHREGELSGVQYHVSQFLTGGYSEADVVLDFLQSAEYQAAHASDAAFVAGLYEDVLSRDADADGAAHWVADLQAGRGRCAVAQDVIVSEESYRRMVDGYYAAFLHRPGEDGGVSHWLGRLHQGTVSTAAVCGGARQGGPNSIATIGQLFLTDDEYVGNAAAAAL